MGGITAAFTIVVLPGRRISSPALWKEDWRTMIRFVLVPVILTALLTAVPASIAQSAPDEEVIVTSNAYPVPFANLSKAVTVLTREDISNLPAHSVAEAIAMAASIDLRPRAPFGLQTDISIRGSAFSQVLVLVDGVRINDPQTAHHNADFPVQLQDVERIEVLRGPGSSIYGADAFGGIINLITRRNTERLSASVAGGQHDFLEGSFTAGFRRGTVEQSISVTGTRSSGFEYDRDFRNVSISARTSVGAHSSFFVSHVNKEFGANNFYGPSPSREWTNQTMVSAEQRHDWKSGNKALFQEYYRTHGDRFLYDTRTPALFESNHRTQSAGVLAKVQSPLSDVGVITVGAELGGDWISSNNLGNHRYARTSLFTEVEWAIGKAATVYPGLRFDY
jgi:outer membrane receptor for ferrienterochelin and colicin